MLNRRMFATSIITSLFIPSIVNASSIMPIKSITPVADRIERDWLNGKHITGQIFKLERAISLGNTTKSPCITNCIFFDKHVEYKCSAFELRRELENRGLGASLIFYYGDKIINGTDIR